MRKIPILLFLITAFGSALWGHSITSLMRPAHPAQPVSFFTSFEQPDSPWQMSYARGTYQNEPDPNVIALMGPQAQREYADYMARQSKQNPNYQLYGDEDASPKVRETVYKALHSLGMKNIESIQVKKLNKNQIAYGFLRLDGLCSSKTIWIREDSLEWYFTCFHEAVHCFRSCNNLNINCSIQEEEFYADWLAAHTLCLLGENEEVRKTINSWKLYAHISMIETIQQSVPNERQYLMLLLLNSNLEKIIETYKIEFNNTCLFQFLSHYENGYPNVITKIRTLQAAMNYWDAQQKNNKE